MKKNIFKNKVILVTGGTGSFGKYFVKKLIKEFNNFKKLIVFSRDELKQSEMSLNKDYDNPKIRFIIGDIRDYSSINRALAEVDIVIHAAALKQVPAAEYNPFQFIKTNIIGAQNLIEASLNNNVKKVISLSTDKASSPINLYGASKLCFEKLFLAANNIKGKKNINFVVVRYGNVMGSRGSILPLFNKQKSKNLQITITNKKMTRFNISLEEACQLVIKSIDITNGGEIIVPKIPSFKIIDLAYAVSNNKNFKIIGKRPGEKLHEELISEYEGEFTIEYKNYFIIYPQDTKKNKLSILAKREKGILKGESFSYSSDKNSKYLNVNDLKKINLSFLNNKNN